MMTPNQLLEIERLGALMFSTAEICLILGLAFDDYIYHEDFQDARDRGRLREEALVRASVFELAKAGSAPAQTLAKLLIDQARIAQAGA